MQHPELILYSTWGCHLCEQAEQLLSAQQLQYRLLDIVDDEVAFAQFRTSIPVLAAGPHLLAWPFDAVTLGDFIRQVRLQGN
jgi:hypothetical protein